MRLETLTPFDVYEGDPVPEGSNVASPCVCALDTPSVPYAGEEVDGYMTNIISAFARARYTIRE